MNNLLEWFSSGLKLKRWFFLMLIGVVLMSVGIAKFTSSDELEILQLIIYGVLFVFGFASVIMSYVMSQRRILQAIAEANGFRDLASSETLNPGDKVYFINREK